MSSLAILLFTAVIVTLAGMRLPARGLAFGAAAGLILALVFEVGNYGSETVLFNGLYVHDSFATAFTIVLIFGALFALAVGRRYLERTNAEYFEYYALILFAVIGGHVMAATTNLVVILIGLEILSLPLYVLAGFRRDATSLEASLKYFLLGAASSGVLLYGIVLYYGATGSFTIGAGEGGVFAAAMILLLAGLGFKAALFPFHWWTPDVYQGSPTPVTLFMATSVKVAAFAALARLLIGTGPLGTWAPVLLLMIAFTVLWGNVAALVQTQAKRVLAYSSVAHAGYLALGTLGPDPVPALLFYLLVYTLSTGLAFAILSVIDRGHTDLSYSDLGGLFQRDPLLGLAWAAAMLSLAGLPPLAGFWAKYLLFMQAAEAGQYALLAFALLTSAVAAYYYLRLLAAAFFARPEGLALPPVSTTARVAVTVAAALVVLFGVWPGLGFDFFLPASQMAAR